MTMNIIWLKAKIYKSFSQFFLWLFLVFCMV